jgi:monofunctional biosynthetic peptidoglycan transglycosylase
VGREHGAVGRDGLGMLVEQAAEAFLVWRGVRPPSAQVLAELRALLAAGGEERVLRWLGLVPAGRPGLQLFFVLRIAAMAVVDPESTTFQRSEAWRIATERSLRWRQQWVPYDADLRQPQARGDRVRGRQLCRTTTAWTGRRSKKPGTQRQGRGARRASRPLAGARPRRRPGPKIVGGSTITQQLAKNLLLSGERTLLRKGQELVLTLMLERC